MKLDIQSDWKKTEILKSAFDLAMIIPLSAVGLTLEFWKGVRKVIIEILK